MAEKGIDVQVLDCTIVKDTKLKNNKVIGKVRLAPRGFRDTSEKARFFSTSPTATSVSVRNSEILGLQRGLKSGVFDVSDATDFPEVRRRRR